MPDFIDEWVSAPYEAQQKDAKVIRAGLAWIDGEAKKRLPELVERAHAGEEIVIT